MSVDLLDLVKEVKRLGKQALGKRAGEPASGGYARITHLVLNCIRINEGYGYRKTINRVSYFTEVCEVLGLDPENLPDFTTLYKSFDRLEMWVLRTLLRLSSEQLPNSGHAAIDDTYFERNIISQHYKRRSNRRVKTLQTTVLVDTASKAVLDVHCSTKWPDETKTGPQVAKRNVGDLQSLSADKGFDDKSFREELRSHNIRPLIKHRVFASYDHAHNARIDDDLYNQRWMAETVFSSVKRSLGSAVRASFWYREFRELIACFALYNIKIALPSL